MSKLAWRIVLVTALGLGLSLGLLGLLASWSGEAQASPDTLYVSATDPTCGGHSPCYANVQDAVDAAAAGDEVLVAGGTYTDTDTASVGYVVALSKSITLRGGYDASFAEPPDPATNPTRLDGQRQGRVISITGDISPTIEGFIITGGDATGLGGSWSGGSDAGGGICCNGAHPVIVGNVITNNVASNSTDTIGGGLYLGYCQRAVLSGNTIVSNTASTDGSGYGAGGGAVLEFSNGAVISGNVVLHNTAGAGAGQGGGLVLFYNDATIISGSSIVSNTAAAGGMGQGGGLYLYDSDVTLGGNVIVGNVASRGGFGVGGGLYIQYGVVTVGGNTVRGNVGRHPGTGLGGGFYVAFGDGLTLDSNWIVGNAAQEGSALLVVQGSTFTLTNNVIVGNQAWSQGGGLHLYGSSADPTSGRLLHNTIADNGEGEGLHVEDYVALTLTNNVVAGHVVGITNTRPSSSTVAADYTLFYGNVVDYGGGVVSTNELHGDPAFANPAGGDYHLGSNSVAIDAGLFIPWLTRDIDGDPRPNGPDYDIGADEFVCLPLSEVTITGPATGTVGIAYDFTAVITPTGASSPMTYTWTPEPDAGQSSAVVTYTWMTTGSQVITVTAENCGGVADDSHVIVLSASPHWHVYLPLVLRND